MYKRVLLICINCLLKAYVAIFLSRICARGNLMILARTNFLLRPCLRCSV